MLSSKMIERIGDPRESRTQVKFLSRLQDFMENLLDEADELSADDIFKKAQVAKVCIAYREMLLKDRYIFIEELLSADNKKIETLNNLLKSADFTDKLENKKLTLADIYNLPKNKTS